MTLPKKELEKNADEEEAPVREIQEIGGEKMDDVLAHALGAVPVEVSQLRSMITRNFFRLILVASFVISFVLLVYFDFRNTRQEKFIAVKRDGSSVKCEKVRQQTFSGSFELDSAGSWSSSSEFKETESILRFDFQNFPSEHYEEAMYAAVAELESFSQEQEQWSYLQNTLFATVLKRNLAYGEGSLEISLAADASALFGSASSYLVSAASCPSARYSPDYGYSYNSPDGAFVSEVDRFEYHVESLENGRILRSSWPRASLEACVSRPWLAIPTVSEYLGSGISGNPIDMTLSLDLDWYSVAAASAINENVISSPYEFMNLIYTFDISNDDSDQILYDDWFDSESAARAYWYDYWQTETSYRWRYRTWPIYEEATANYCPNTIPNDFFHQQSTKTYSIFRDPRVTDMQDIVCHFDNDAWICAIVIGNLHAYPHFAYADSNCNVCDFNDDDNVSCSSNRIHGMLFLRSFEHDGGFTSKPYDDNRDEYWLAVKNRRSNASTFVNDIPGVVENMALLDLQGPETAEITTYTSCALDFDGLAIGISAIATSTSETIPRRTDTGADASPDWWHCSNTWLDTATQALYTVLDANHAPVNFFENYYECQTKRFPAMIDAFGIGFANARTFVYIVAICIAFCLIKIFPNRAYRYNTVVSENEIQDHARLLTIQAKLDGKRKQFHHDDENTRLEYEEE
mmetsp:Transcript_1458/g.1927  ORF Transcript_1458/g.1927 Transcript_1458/m.1927 type:complete len:689 (+) Transcript_1458:66-2132(+)